MKWTKEQQDAIYKDGKNIIVSAGAGSGKTAVLSERVLEKLNNGTNINELLILTFTEAAASEMKERIRKKIKKDERLKDQLNLIDSSYITTFDSYAMSIVKKYHYLLNVRKELSIIESSVIAIKKKEILDNIFDYYYENKDLRFLKLINTFCIKDDEDIKKNILRLNDKLDLKIDKINYLTNYIDNNYNNSTINSYIDSYDKLLIDKIKIVKETIDNLSIYLDNDYITKLLNSVNNLLNSTNYNEIKSNLNIKLPSLPKGLGEDIKKEKEKVKKSIDDISKLCPYQDKQEIYNSLISTKDYVSIICEIIIKLHNKIMEYKQNNDIYEFNDIAIMSINILDNEEVRDEIKYHFK